jgi:hypothetical protein
MNPADFKKPHDPYASLAEYGQLNTVNSLIP